MAEEDYICPDCAFSSEKEEACPFCGVKLVKWDEGLEKETAYNDDNYGRDGMDMAEGFDIDEMPAM